MNFTRNDVDQLTPEYISKLPIDRVRELIEQMRQDVITFSNQENLNSTNTAIPSGEINEHEHQ